MSLGEYLKEYSFDNLLDSMLDKVPDEIDKREGSIIYDALAPAAYQLALVYMNLYNMLQDTFATSAVGEYLDLKVAEQGLERMQASKATKLAEFRDSSGELMEVPIGSRFSTVGQDEQYYKVIEKQSVGKFVLESETIGAAANRYVGQLLPVDNINKLGTSTMSGVYISGRDKETDDELRARYFQAVTEKPFAGNFAAYQEEALKIKGVGNVQVFPTFDGGGTVGLMVVDDDGLPVSVDLKAQVKNYFDPEDNETEGTGISPIGHRVTVEIPIAIPLDISVSVTYSAGVDVANVKNEIKASIDRYIQEIRDSWGNHDELYNYTTYIYTAKLLVAVLQTEGVNNAANIKINGQNSDLVWNQSMNENKVPVVGVITISEV